MSGAVAADAACGAGGIGAGGSGAGKPVIAVAPLFDAEKDSYWMLPGYFDMLEACGALPVMFSFGRFAPGGADEAKADARQLLSACDGLLLTGGDDIDPARYGEAALSVCGAPNAWRDSLETRLFTRALGIDLPVLGICRGLQFINVHLGGTLYQDLAAQHPSALRHTMDHPYDEPAHLVRLVSASPLATLAHATELSVNSCHHQGVRDVAPTLEPLAYAPDGLVEAVRLPNRTFVWGVQWHPEFMWRKRPEQLAIVRAFVQSAARFRANR